VTATGEEVRAWTLADPPTSVLAGALPEPRATELVMELAHDLRTPLSSVLVAAEVLQSGRAGPLTAAQREQLRLLHSAVRTLCHVTEDVLEVTRAGGGTPLGPRVPFTTAEVLRTVHDLLVPTAAARGIALRLHGGAAQPRLGHPRALERVLLNLAVNAIKFTDRGWVELSARPEGAEPELVRFAVRDTGRGISRAAAEALLEPFPSREVRERHGFSGAGIGLVVCRRLIAAMDGTLRLDSRPAHGSRFHFTLALPYARD
jgi:signal transduction histidine kinase